MGRGLTSRGLPPWLSPEDATLLAALDPDARRQFSNLLHQQARDQLEWDLRVEADLDTAIRASGERQARQYAAGGGRARRGPVDVGS